MTSGLSSSAVTEDLPKKRRRASAIEARIPSRTAPTLESAATIALVSSAALRSEFVRNWWYQWSVKPLSGNEGTCESLKEKISRIAIGAYRKTTTSAKNVLRRRAPFFESAASISPFPIAERVGTVRTRQ